MSFYGDPITMTLLVERGIRIVVETYEAPRVRLDGDTHKEPGAPFPARTEPLKVGRRQEDDS